MEQIYKSIDPDNIYFIRVYKLRRAYRDSSKCNDSISIIIDPFTPLWVIELFSLRIIYFNDDTDELLLRHEDESVEVINEGQVIIKIINGFDNTVEVNSPETFDLSRYKLVSEKELNKINRWDRKFKSKVAEGFYHHVANIIDEEYYNDDTYRWRYILNTASEADLEKMDKTWDNAWMDVTPGDTSSLIDITLTQYKTY